VAKPAEVSSQITALLQQETPDYQAVMELVYPEMRAIAYNKMARERNDHTLSATALVHETYMRVAGGAPVKWAGSGHFFHVAALAMRRILIDHARAKQTAMRASRTAMERVALFSAINGIDSAIDLLAEGNDGPILSLEAAMCRLEQQDQELASLVRLRFYAGLTIEQTAAALGTSIASVKRRWAFGRAILIRAMRESVVATNHSREQ